MAVEAVGVAEVAAPKWRWSDHVNVGVLLKPPLCDAPDDFSDWNSRSEGPTGVGVDSFHVASVGVVVDTAVDTAVWNVTPMPLVNFFRPHRIIFKWTLYHVRCMEPALKS